MNFVGSSGSKAFLLIYYLILFHFFRGVWGAFHPRVIILIYWRCQDLRSSLVGGHMIVAIIGLGIVRVFS